MKEQFEKVGDAIGAILPPLLGLVAALTLTAIWYTAVRLWEASR